MRRLALVLSCGVGFAAVTWLGGWWGALVMAGILGAMLQSFAPGLVGLAAGLAWLGMILQADRHGSLGRLLERLGGVFGIPGWTIVALAAGVAFLTCWSGARVGSLLRREPRTGNR